MNLRELKSAINSIHDDYDGYTVRVLPGTGDVMLAVTPDLPGRKMLGTERVVSVLLIQEAATA